MKACVVRSLGETPAYTDFAAPSPAAGHSIVRMHASALSWLARGRASGSHYSSNGHFPFVAGVDGVGTTDDGRRVYFCGPRAPHGAFADYALVPDAHCIVLPDTLDDITAAAIAIPGMSSWAALTERARFRAGETVLVNGATGASGQLAVRIAKHLGAKKVIATGRDPDVLDALRVCGADATIALQQERDALAEAFAEHCAAGVDVVLDYLWGPSAQLLLATAAKTLSEGYPLRFVQIGSMGGAELSLPGAVLRASAITLMGSGIGSVSFGRLLDAVRAVFAAARQADLRIETRAEPLSEIGDHWSRDDGARIVFVMR